MIGNDLYKKAPNGVLLKYVSSNDDKHLLLDIHEGICGSHAAGRTLVGKAFRQGFFWPTALKDACDMVQRCEACQFHSKHIAASASTPDYPSHLAVLVLGARYTRAIPTRTGRLQVPIRGDRQIHQVD
jgi:hypothetical protein